MIWLGPNYDWSVKAQSYSAVQPLKFLSARRLAIQRLTSRRKSCLFRGGKHGTMALM